MHGNCWVKQYAIGKKNANKQYQEPGVFCIILKSLNSKRKYNDERLGIEYPVLYWNRDWEVSNYGSP